MLVALVLTLAAGAAVVGIGGQSPADGVRLAPTALPAGMPAGAAAPADPAVEPPAGSLAALLRLAPDWTGQDDQGLPVLATYADLDRWFAASGSDRAALDPGQAGDAVAPLALPETLVRSGFSDVWRSRYGFDLRQVDQVLAVGQVPNLILIMPGRFDADALHAAWVASGYQAVEVAETTVWSLAPGDRIDLTAPASQPSLGMLNQVVLLDEGILIATARQSHMADALRVVRGEADSLLDHDGLREAAMMPSNLSASSAVIADGTLLLQAEPGGASADLDALPMVNGVAIAAPPPVALVVVALAAPDETGQLTVVTTLLLDEPLRDDQAVLAALDQRARAGADWASRYDLQSITSPGANGDMLAVRYRALAAEASLPVLATRQELAPFTWYASS